MTPAPSELVEKAIEIFDSARNREDLGDWAIKFGPRLFIEIERLSAELARLALLQINPEAESIVNLTKTLLERAEAAEKELAKKSEWLDCVNKLAEADRKAYSAWRDSHIETSRDRIKAAEKRAAKLAEALSLIDMFENSSYRQISTFAKQTARKALAEDGT